MMNHLHHTLLRVGIFFIIICLYGILMLQQQSDSPLQQVLPHTETVLAQAVSPSVLCGGSENVIYTPVDLREYVVGSPGHTHMLSTGEQISYEGSAPGPVKMYKNANYEQFIINGTDVNRREDTSWAPLPGFQETHCTNGDEAAYSLHPGCEDFSSGQSPSADGTTWIPAANSKATGDSWTTQVHQVVPISEPAAIGGTLQGCALDSTGGLDQIYKPPTNCGQSNNLELLAVCKPNTFTFCSGLTNPDNLAIIQVKSGPGTGDTFYYVEGMGLVGFEAPGFEAGLDGPGATGACSSGNIPGPLACGPALWEPVGESLPITQVSCACDPATCPPLEDPITFSRPTNQDTGQVDGTGTGDYRFYDNDLEQYIVVPPAFSASSGLAPTPPIIVGDCLACPVTSANLGYTFCQDTFYNQRHHGLDYLVPPGTPIYSATDGTVTLARWDGGYGYSVRISDPANGYLLIYAHMDPAFLVAAGDTVTAGQQIGTVGPLCLDCPSGVPDNSASCTNCSNGTTSTPHLHFEIRTGSFSYDPNSCQVDQTDPQQLLPGTCGGFCSGTPQGGSCSAQPNCNPSATFNAGLNTAKSAQEIHDTFNTLNTFIGRYYGNINWDNVNMCYNDVVSQAQQKGVDPSIALAIWLEESGASNCQQFPGVADFGCAVNTPRENFTAQAACFMNLPSAYANPANTFFQPCRERDCPAGQQELTVEKFLQTYSGGPNACVNDNFGSNPHFDQQIHEFFKAIRKDSSVLNDQRVLPFRDWGSGSGPQAACVPQTPPPGPGPL